MADEPKIFRDRFLADRMRLRADMDGLPRAHELRTLADALDGMDEALDIQGIQTNVVHVRNAMAVWDSAYKAWSDYTGEQPQRNWRGH